MPRRVLAIAVCGLTIVAFGCKPEGTPPTSPPSQPSGADTISLNPAIVYQTMNGWEVPILNTVLDYDDILPFMGPLMDQAVNDLGLNKIAIGQNSGDENPSEACQVQYLNRMINEGAYTNNCAYNVINDNNDPNVVNPNGFHFLILDWQIDHLVLPMKQRVEARGEKLYVLLTYVDFEPSAFKHYQNPEEYAELMQVVFEHMRTKYGFVPDGINVMNEPDQVPGWDATTMGRVIARTGPRLAALGYQPDFVGPSSVDKGRAVPYFDAMMAVSGVNRYLKDLSWHCYADSAANSSSAIGGSAVRYGVRTSMTECWSTGNTYQLFHQELKSSRNASWQVATINGLNGYYEVNATTGQVTLRPKAKYFRQYFKFVRAGARRIEATTTNAAFDPVAFINTDGTYVVVVKASAAGTFTVGNLPAGTYGLFHTTGPDGLTVSSYDVKGPDQAIVVGQSVSATIPGAGVLTIYAKTRATNGLASTGFTGSSSSSQTAVTTAAQDTYSSVAPWPVRTEIATHDGVRLRLKQLDGQFVDPVDLSFAPGGRMFLAERGGQIFVFREGRLIAEPALGVDRYTGHQEEFVSMAVDPQFERTHYVYTISTVAGPSGGRSFRLARYREAGDRLADRITLLDEIPSAPGSAAASLRFGPDGKLFAAFDDAGVDYLRGDLASANGKVLRMNADGSTPDDQAGGNPLFSYSYRSPHGLDWQPTTRNLWIADVSTAEAGRLDVVATSDGAQKKGVGLAALALPGGVAPSSLAFYGNSGAPLSNSLFIASEKGRQLLRLQFDPNDPTRAVAAERLLEGTIGGIRVVAIGPDGSIYVATANALGKLEPVR